VGFFPPGAGEGTLGEGMNEHGLTVSAQSFNSQGRYQEPAEGKKALSCVSVVPFLLGLAKSASEAVALVEEVAVVDEPAFSAMVGRFHWSVQDETGAMVVLEYVDGALRLHDASRVGVLTNDPHYDWHLLNLNNYALYSLDRVQDSSWGAGGPPRVFGHGLNTVGLPGSYAPPDRFVKMFLLREAAVANAPPADTAAAVALASGLLNTIHIVMGTVANTEAEDAGGLEWTEWSVIKIPAERRFLVRTYSALGWREIDLKTVDFTKSTPPVPLYRGLDLRAFEFDAPPATQEL
jgi:choloylglycine hydrolase